MQPREHSVLCSKCHNHSTWNDDGICDYCKHLAEPLGVIVDYVTCDAFLSMHHPIRVKTRNMHCTALIPVSDLPGPCPSCGQWRSA